MQNGPQAISDTKRLILEASRLTIDDNFAEHLAVEHALKRRSQEASEGLLSFLEKREALWFKGK
jgi:methylglutaconyl-CoA hydratase